MSGYTYLEKLWNSLPGFMALSSILNVVQFFLGLPLINNAFIVCSPKPRMCLCLIKLFLRLLTARTSPVFQQIFKGDAIMLRRIINIATDGADILS